MKPARRTTFLQAQVTVTFHTDSQVYCPFSGNSKHPCPFPLSSGGSRQGDALSTLLALSSEWGRMAGSHLLLAFAGIVSGVRGRWSSTSVVLRVLLSGNGVL